MASTTPQPHTPDASFAAHWSATVLAAPPLIAPARQYTLPRPVPGEEDALARGALLVQVRPQAGGLYLLTCALGFRDPSAPSGLWTCPNPDHLLAVAGGYAYLVPVAAPETTVHLPLRPVTRVLPAPAEGLLLLAGLNTVIAVNADGLAWQSGRLSWEGVTLDAVRAGTLHGAGWNMHTDRDVPFELDLATGQHTGGGFALH